MPGKLNRKKDDQLLEYLHPFLEERFGSMVWDRTPYQPWDYFSPTYLIEAKGRGARVTAYESYRLARSKFEVLRKVAAERGIVPVFAWAFSDAVVYADLVRIAPEGMEIPWRMVGRTDRIGTPREGAHDIEECWDVPRVLVHTLVTAPRWDPIHVVDRAA